MLKWYFYITNIGKTELSKNAPLWQNRFVHWAASRWWPDDKIISFSSC